jgi:hypothetical protein
MSADVSIATLATKREVPHASADDPKQQMTTSVRMWSSDRARRADGSRIVPAVSQSFFLVAARRADAPYSTFGSTPIVRPRCARGWLRAVQRRHRGGCEVALPPRRLLADGLVNDLVSRAGSRASARIGLPENEASPHFVLVHANARMSPSIPSRSRVGRASSIRASMRAAPARMVLRSRRIRRWNSCRRPRPCADGPRLNAKLGHHPGTHAPTPRLCVGSPRMPASRRRDACRTAVRAWRGC